MFEQLTRLPCHGHVSSQHHQARHKHYTCHVNLLDRPGSQASSSRSKHREWHCSCNVRRQADPRVQQCLFMLLKMYVAHMHRVSHVSGVTWCTHYRTYCKLELRANLLYATYTCIVQGMCCWTFISATGEQLKGKRFGHLIIP